MVINEIDFLVTAKIHVVFGDFKVSKCLKDDVVWSWYFAVIQRFDSVLA